MEYYKSTLPNLWETVKSSPGESRVILRNKFTFSYACMTEKIIITLGGGEERQATEQQQDPEPFLPISVLCYPMEEKPQHATVVVKRQDSMAIDASYLTEVYQSTDIPV